MSDKQKNEPTPKEPFVNPIDKDKVAENPGLLPYAHTVGGVPIKPIDKGREKGLAVKAMQQQTDMQMAQLYQQMELLAEQADKIKRRMELSEKIYTADMGFKPIIGHSYHFYEKKDGSFVMSLIGQHEWGRRGVPFEAYLGKVRLLADHTWEVED